MCIRDRLMIIYRDEKNPKISKINILFLYRTYLKSILLFPIEAEIQQQSFENLVSIDPS